MNGVPVETLDYAYDALGRPVTRNADAFGYNARSEVVSATVVGGSPSPATASYGYDDIGNSTNWSANCLNQYTLCGSVSPCEFSYDLDRNMLSDGNLSFTYDAANRLASVSSNDVVLAAFTYDAQGRRIIKMLNMIRKEMKSPPFYSGILFAKIWRKVRVSSHDIP